MKHVLVLLALSGFVCGCTSGLQRAEMAAIDYESFVHVAAINADTKNATHVEAVLKENGIPCTIEGSVAYGVSVPPRQKEAATRILRADAKKRGYWIAFP